MPISGVLTLSTTAGTAGSALPLGPAGLAAVISQAPVISAPACAADTSSFCSWIWTRTGVGWLAENAPMIGTTALQIVLVLVVALVIRRLAHRLIDRVTIEAADGRAPALLRPLRERADVLLLGSVGATRRSQRARSIGSVLKSTVSLIVALTTLIVVLEELGINVTPVVASAGIAGVALGFGAQNLVKDFISGIFMLLEDQYGVGDTVDLGSANGTVTAVGLRITTVRGVDGTVWYVRNGEVLRVGNSSQGESVVTIDLPLSYRADAAKAGDLALAAAGTVADSEDFVDQMVKPPEMQGIATMTADAVTIRLVATVKAGQQWTFGRAVRDAIKSAFDEAGVQAPVTDLRGPARGRDVRSDDAT